MPRSTITATHYAANISGERSATIRSISSGETLIRPRSRRQSMTANRPRRLSRAYSKAIFTSTTSMTHWSISPSIGICAGTKTWDARSISYLRACRNRLCSRRGSWRSVGVDVCRRISFGTAMSRARHRQLCRGRAARAFWSLALVSGTSPASSGKFMAPPIISSAIFPRR